MHNYYIYLLAYIAGSVPFGFIITNIYKSKDIRNEGSGNIGATNAFRVGGKFIGIVTLILDATKGILPLYIATKLAMSYNQILIVGVLSVLGHIFPVWLQFKGGKGVATSLANISFLNWPIGLTLVIVWLVIFWLKRISALSSIMIFIIAPILSYIYVDNYLFTFFIFIISFIVIIKHYNNIIRLIHGREEAFKKK